MGACCQLLSRWMIFTNSTHDGFMNVVRGGEARALVNNNIQGVNKKYIIILSLTQSRKVVGLGVRWGCLII